MHRPSHSLPTRWLGANFWSRTGGPLMWRNYDRSITREELVVLGNHGLNMTRSFFYWPDFHPTPERIDTQLCEHFNDFLNAHAEVGMTTIPTFIVGHMSGENWDPPWRGGRDLYTDTWFVGRQAFYIEYLTSIFAAHPAISGWLISNEVPIYGNPAPTEVITEWARLMVHAVRAAGGHQPISIGDGAWGEEITGVSNGFSIKDLAAFTDFVGPHVYKMETDIVRQHHKAAFICELAAIANKPVVVEEFGLSTDFASPENSGHYYRQVLNNTLLAGASGWIAWNNTDYDDLVDQRPYSHHPFEMHFGITDQRGRPKPPLLEMQAFQRRLSEIDVDCCHRTDTNTAVVVSSYLADGYEFIDPVQRQLVASSAEQAYIAAKQADLAPAVIREATDGLVPTGFQLYLLPSVKELNGSTWKQLICLAQAGAVVYASYSAGESDFQRGPWWSFLDQLWGVRHELSYGINNPVEADCIEFTVKHPFGTLAPGDVLRFSAAGNANSRAYLPVTVIDGTIIALDSGGRPALVGKRHGAGMLVLGTYPTEYFAAKTGAVNPEDTWRLYQALAAEAGVLPQVWVDDPRVLVDSLTHQDGRRFYFFTSQSAEHLTVEPMGDNLTTLHGNAAGHLSLNPYAVEILVGKVRS